jgi:biotin transport system substrate-specific component
MQREITSPLLPSASRKLAHPSVRAGARAAGTIVAGSLLLAVCAHVSLPLWFTPVPLSLQPFAVLLLAMLLSPRMAGATLVAYLAEGAVGLPVFAPSPLAGAAHLLGPTGGYLMAYPIAAVLVSWLWRRMGRGFSVGLLSAAAGDAIILTCGALWLAATTHAHAGSVLTTTIGAFLPGDALKVAAAAGIAAGWQRVRRVNP